MNFRKNKLFIISLLILFPFISTAEDSNFEKVWQYEINYSDKTNTVQAQANEFEDLILVVDGIGNLNALNKKTGVLVYQTALGKNVGRRGFAIDQESGQIIIVSSRTLYILDAKSGVILKQTKTIQSSVTPILTSECIIVFGSIDGNINCHSRNLDEIFWQTKLGGTARIWSNVTMSKKHNKLYLITSNAGGIIAEKRAPDTYSSSLVAIDVTSGSIEFSLQMINDDVWDFDGVGKPIYVEGFINDDGKEYDVIIGLNKTGTIFAVNAENGSPIKDGQFKKKKFSKGTGVNAIVTDSQIIPSWPNRINEIFLTPSNLRLDEMKTGALRHSRFEEFLPPSLDYDVVTRGIHGGPEWQGGLHYKNNDQNLLAIPYNNTSWILRLKYMEKESRITRYTYKILNRINKLFSNAKNSFNSVKKFFLVENKHFVKNSEKYLDKNSQKTEELIVDDTKTRNPWILTSWSDSNSSAQLKDKIYKFTNIKAYNAKYYKHCASCHRNDRAGRYQNEIVGDGFVPSLVGYSLTKKYEYGKNYNNFVSLHGSDVDVTKEDFDKILKFYDKYDKQQ